MNPDELSLLAFSSWSTVFANAASVVFDALRENVLNEIN